MRESEYAKYAAYAKMSESEYAKYASVPKYGYEYEYNGKLHVLFSVKSFNGSIWNRFDRSAITPSGNDDGLWHLVLVPSDNIGNPVVFRDGFYTEQEAKACQEDLHKYLAEFFRRW